MNATHFPKLKPKPNSSLPSLFSFPPHSHHFHSHYIQFLSVSVTTLWTKLSIKYFPLKPKKKVFPRTKKKVPFSFIFVLNSRVSVCLKIFLGLNSCSFQLYCKWVRSHFVSDLLHFVLKFVFLWLFFVGLWLFHVWSCYV